jgi:hypothetical protein
MISFTPTLVFHQFTLKSRWVVSMCAAGMLQSEFDIRIEHLQDGVDLLVITGESQPRPIGEQQPYSYKLFQKNIRPPKDALIAGSKTSNFADGLLLIAFDLGVTSMKVLF